MVNGVRRHGTTIVKSVMPWEERSLWKNWKNGCKLDTRRVFIGKKKAGEAKMKNIENNIQTICRISKKKKKKKIETRKEDILGKNSISDDTEKLPLLMKRNRKNRKKEW